MDRFKPLISMIVLSFCMVCHLSSCKKKIKLEEIEQIYFTPGDVLVMSGSHKDSWQYLDVYDSNMMNTKFSYSKEIHRMMFVDSVSGNRIFLSVGVFDYYTLPKNSFPKEDYTLYEKGNYDMYIKKIHLGGSSTLDDIKLKFLYRRGNDIYVSRMAPLTDTVLNLKDIGFSWGGVNLRTIPSHTNFSTPMSFVDSANFDAFKRSLNLY